jgi:two-component system chemotaxis response regulator CheY
MTPLDGLHILILDDEPFIRSTIKAALRVVGRFIVSEAADGETALRMLPTSRPDLVLCDVNMAPMNGLQFVERLRAQPDPELRDLAVVMITTQADVATVQNAGQLRISGYLVKPVSPKQLGDRLRAIFA